MLRRLWLSMRRDNLINFRNHYYTVVLAVAALYLVALMWLIPENATVQHATYVVDQTAGARVAADLQTRDTQGRVTVLSTPDELRTAMSENRNSVGLLFADGRPLPAVTLFFQGHENQRLQNLLAASTEDLLREIYGQPWPHSVPIAHEVLRGAGAPPAVPLRQMLLPIFLFSDPALVGLIFIAALLFMEKQEGTLRAYLVSPGRVWEYLLSKALTLTFLALIFTLILVQPVMGAGPDYLAVLALMALGSIFSALLGAWAAIYFDNLAQFLFPAVALMAVLTLPTASYLAPSFSPVWIRLFPTYPLVFGLREALSPTGRPQIIYTALATLLVLDGLLLAAASLSFRRQIASS
ncbi:MAG TPA: ABC transporter permease [Symbiobacteriaceae bacterium]|nr:ABC transporter permease [Symbiobacteriaceae bacterium]